MEKETTVPVPRIIRNDIDAIIDHVYSDEEKHYHTATKAEQKNHIFSRIERVLAWLQSDHGNREEGNTMTRALREDVDYVESYLYEDESENYGECKSDDREGHIIHPLDRVAGWLLDTEVPAKV